MAELRATPMSNPIMGLLADRLKKVQQFGAKPFGYENPPVEMLMNLLGIPAVQQTMERMAYGEPLTTGSGMTTKPRPESIDAAMAVAPVAGLLGRGAEKTAMAAGRAGERYAEKVVPQIMERGGLPAGLLQDLAQGTKSQIFIGPFSKAFDKNAAITAFQLEKKGASPQEIWQQTGTVRGPDGQWRQEISDMASTIKGDKPFEDVIMGAYQRGAADTNNQLYKTTVEDVFMHNRLKDAYPELMAIETQMERKGSNAKGSLAFDPKTGEQIIGVKSTLSPEEARSTMLHELQHSIQEAENFAVGGNVETVTDLIAQSKYNLKDIERKIINTKDAASDEARFYIAKAKREPEFKKFVDDAFEKYKAQLGEKSAERPFGVDLQDAVQFQLLEQSPILQNYIKEAESLRRLANLDPYEGYRALMGEAEARLVQNRRNLSSAERKQFFPFEFRDKDVNPYGLDVPLKSLIHLDERGNLIEKGILGQ